MVGDKSMKNPVYIRCPRCELNYIQKKDKFCSVCKKEMKALGSQADEDDLDLELCPICKVNYINPDEDMCVQCAKEHALEEGRVNDLDNDDDWNTTDDEDGIYSEDEETGDMASITDLNDDPLDDDSIAIDLDEDVIDDEDDEEDKEEDETFDEDFDDDTFDDIDEDK